MTPKLKATWAEQHRIDAKERERLAILQASDLRMARVAEDLLALLVGKGVLAESELLAPAREVLAERRDTRSPEWEPTPQPDRP